VTKRPMEYHATIPYTCMLCNIYTYLSISVSSNICHFFSMKTFKILSASCEMHSALLLPIVVLLCRSPAEQILLPNCTCGPHSLPPFFSALITPQLSTSVRLTF
jgi:hypothetical protein